MGTITNREYFAGIALKVLLEKELFYNINNIEQGYVGSATNLEFYESCKTAAYAIADTMLEQ